MPKLNLSQKLTRRRWRHYLKVAGLIGLGIMLLRLILNLSLILWLHSSAPVDAILVLGGSIRREIHAANIANRQPDLPILISQGSDAPCIYQIFQEKNIDLERVWLERCADSTFGNFFFSVPILRRWGVHHVMLVTSATHLPRALWLAKINLGVQGIWVTSNLAKEPGIPGNHESQLKTLLDLTRSILWAPFSQLLQPPCWDQLKLSDADLSTWYEQGFACEYQGRKYRPQPKQQSE